MKNIRLIGTAAIIAASAFSPAAFAQDAAEMAREHGAAEPAAAVVTRESIEQESEVTDADGQPVVSEDGSVETETNTTGFEQTVETPSGNLHSATKVDGARAMLEHDHAAAPDTPAQPELPDTAAKPEKPVMPADPQ